MLCSGRERLYFATGYGLIQCVKSLMSYADEVRVSRRLLRVKFGTKILNRIYLLVSHIPVGGTTLQASTARNSRSSDPG